MIVDELPEIAEAAIRDALVLIALDMEVDPLPGDDE